MASTAILWVALAIPATASAGLLDDVGRSLNDTVRGVGDTVNGLAGGGGSGAPASGGANAAPASGEQPTQQAATTDPQPEGTNPHAQGSVLELGVPIIDQDVIVGQSRGEQDANGDYHGKVTVVSALGLEAGIETDEGETAQSPLAPVNDILNQICAGSGNNVCLTVLDYSSTTTNNGSSNSFSAATANVGAGLVAASLLESNGTIADDGDCQAAVGSSSATDVSALGVLGADALDAGSASAACRDGSKAAAGSSTVGGVQPLIRLSTLLGCDDTAESPFSISLVLVELANGVCNATTTSQAVPFNVQKALMLDLLPLGMDPLVELVAVAAESLARAPAGPEPRCPDPGNPACDEDESNPDDNPPDRRRGAGPGFPGRPTAAGPGHGTLPFTGLDVGLMALIAVGIAGTGLGLMELADRRSRRLGTPQ